MRSVQIHGIMASSPLHGFRHLGNNIYLHPADSSAPKAPLDDELQCPSIVVLCTWLGGASPRRIAKYTFKYRQTYPGTPILLIRTVMMDLALRPALLLRHRLKPAIAAISKYVTTPEDGILLHMFSNGGANMAVQLAIALRSVIRSSVSFSPFRMVILDCCPTFTSFRSQYHAAVFSLPSSQPVNLLGRSVMFPFVGSVAILQNLGLVGSGADLRKDLNRWSVFGASPLRLYMYSKTDTTVPYYDVESHKADAERKGYTVQSLSFDEAPHCALINAGEDRYWDAIISGWTTACQNQASPGTIRSKL